MSCFKRCAPQSKSTTRAAVGALRSHLRAWYEIVLLRREEIARLSALPDE